MTKVDDKLSTNLDRLLARIADRTITTDGFWTVKRRSNGSLDIKEVRACGRLSGGDEEALARLTRTASCLWGPVHRLGTASECLLHEAGYAGPVHSPASVGRLKMYEELVAETSTGRFAFLAGERPDDEEVASAAPILYDLATTFDRLCAYLVAHNVIALSQPNPGRIVHFWHQTRESLAEVRGTTPDWRRTYVEYERAHPGEAESGVAGSFYCYMVRHHASDFEPLPPQVRQQFRDPQWATNAHREQQSAPPEVQPLLFGTGVTRKTRTYPLSALFPVVPVWMPRGARLIRVDKVGDKPVLAAEVDDTAPHVFRRIVLLHSSGINPPSMGMIGTDAECGQMASLGDLEFPVYTLLEGEPRKCLVSFFDGGEM